MPSQAKHSPYSVARLTALDGGRASKGSNISGMATLELDDREPASAAMGMRGLVRQAQKDAARQENPSMRKPFEDSAKPSGTGGQVCSGEDGGTAQATRSKGQPLTSP
jgi:hypothetical protein